MRSLKINIDARGKDHPETATVVSGCAILRWKQARFKESSDLFLQALSVYKNSFGEGHARYVKLLGQYSDFQKESDLIGK